MLLRIIAIISLALLFAGCATQKRIDHGWPADIPPRSYFESVYAADTANQQVQSETDYLVWVVRYYEGWELYRRGWKKATNELLTNIDDPTETEYLTDKMAGIGRSIAGEWAKKSNRRVIHTRHVSVWGNALLEAVARGEELQLVDSIERDVNKLLDKKLPLDAITLERYYARKDDDFFW
jgi:hypothetical protein